MKFFAIIRKSIVIFLLVVVIVLWAILKTNEDVAEAITQTVAKGYGKGLSYVSGVTTHVSFTEVLFVSLIVIALFLLILAIRDFFKFRPIKAVCKLLNIAIIALVVVATYSVSCEAAYNRKKMPLPYYQEVVKHDQFVPIYNYFATDLNNCIEALEFDNNGDLKKMELDVLVKEIKEAYNIVTDPYFYSHFGSVKPLISSFLYREFQITGVTFSPLAEANINTMNTNVDIPLTVAHELAHTKGVMREDDANQLAFYVCLNSANPYLRYSAYNGYFYQMEIISSYLTDEEKATLVPVKAEFNKTRNYCYEYWKKHDALGKLGDFINNLYIKSSGVKEGTDSYSGGTDNYDYDNTVQELSPSTYQSLFLEKYYR